MKKHLYIILTVLFLAVFLISAGYLVNYFIGSYRNQSEFQELSALVQKRADISSSDSKDAQVSAYVEITDPKTGAIVNILPEFAEIYQKNSDLIGWLKIEGTKVDYPVMHTPGRTDYYLRRSFEKKYSKHGCLYAREECDVLAPADNITIYGHNMHDGSMFAVLHSYKKQDFFENHRYIQFDTLRSRNTYEVLAVFLTTATQGQGFAYHRFVDALDQQEFDNFVSTCKALAYYDTGVSAQYGDKFISLSTCDYSRTNGRLVVVAKQVTEN